MRFNYFWSLFLNLALVPLAIYGNQLDVQPATIKITDVHFQGETAKVKLTEKPSGPVKVYIQTGQLVTADKCILEFDQNNWNSGQDVVFNSGASIDSSSKDKNREIIVKLVIECPSDSKYHGKEHEIKIVRTVLESGVCKSTGDPHFSTFDGQKFDYFGKGTVNLVKSDRLVIQADQFICRGKTSCNGRVAIKYYDEVFIWDQNHHASSGKKPSGEVNTKVYGPGKLMKIKEIKKRKVDVILADGSRISLLKQKSKDFWFNNVIIDLIGCYRKQVSGLCGNFDGDASNDPKTDNALKSCHASSSDDVFKCKNKCGTKSKYSIVGQFCEAYKPKPISAYETPKPTSSAYVPPAPTSSAYVPPAPTSFAYVPPAPTSSAYVPPAPTSSAYVPPEPTSSAYVPPAPTSSAYVPPAPTSSAYVPPEPTSSAYVPPAPTPAYSKPAGGSTLQDYENILPVEKPPQNVYNSLPAVEAQDSKAKAACGKAFESLSCGKVDKKFYEEGCILDAASTQDYRDIVNSYVESFLAECEGHCDRLSRSNDGKDLVQAFKIQKQYSFVEISYGGAKDFRSAVSANNIQINGELSNVAQKIETLSAVTCKNGGVTGKAGGCDCKEGFSGVDCSIEISDEGEVSVPQESGAAKLGISLIPLVLTAFIMLF